MNLTDESMFERLSVLQGAALDIVRALSILDANQTWALADLACILGCQATAIRRPLGRLVDGAWVSKLSPEHKGTPGRKADRYALTQTARRWLAVSHKLLAGSIP